MYDTILVPTDGSSGAKAAAQYGLNLASTFNSDVRFLSVIDEWSYSSALSNFDSLADDQRDALEERATGNLRSLEELATKFDIPFASEIKHGTPHKTILNDADEHDIDLVAMGTHGRTGLDRYLLGSVTERVVRTGDVPVLTTRITSNDHFSYEDVLIPTDGSDAANTAIGHGLAIANQYDATVHALSVVDMGDIPTSFNVAALIEAWKGDCEQAVSEVVDAAESHGLDVVTEIHQGTPYRAIKSYVKNEGIDLVAMGTHGREGLDRYLIGSVTARTVRTSEVPVLTVG
ncbi:universal stress protein [Halococcus thailandensis]|uniref:Universal stress protein UspA-like protein n=1 Tax=Halococcus thailandensis JCM 13552 TaxID=1227457 RepID=M0NF12_9EURY|nr:universal stress protein [Halococcus thailandensis]EMA56143.1 universal stress protein UspA-like protein [Halococcus thailandensis JCM 13552]